MNKEVSKLIERVRLKEEEVNGAFDSAFDKPVEFDHKPTPEELMSLRLKAVADAATNKVLKDKDLALMTGKELPPTYFANRKKMPWITDYDVEVCAQKDMLKAGFTHSIIPLAEAIKEAEDEAN